MAVLTSPLIEMAKQAELQRNCSNKGEKTSKCKMTGGSHHHHGHGDHHQQTTESTISLDVAPSAIKRHRRMVSKTTYA